MIPQKQIRAIYDDTTIRVYQAYSDPIADAALANQRFVSPPFKMDRMTWIKPSFLWMMYRSGYGMKDKGQKRILAIDISHEGFAWALQNSCGSRPPDGMSKEDWIALKAKTPVRIQWDPERDLVHAALPHRAIQIGLTGVAVTKYVDEWIVRIEDVTPLAHQIFSHINNQDNDAALALCPIERPYTRLDNHEALG